MRPDNELLELYKVEKAIVIGSINERTGLEAFPEYRDWKTSYLKEYEESHRTVTVKEAYVEAEATQQEADGKDDLTDFVNAVLETLNEKDKTMTEATEATATPTPTDSKPPVAAAAEKRAAKPKAEKPKAVKPAAKPKAAPKKTVAKKPVSKASLAQKVFDRLYPKVSAGKMSRKDVIGKLVADISLTPNGAATYYQKMKKVADAA